VSTYSFKHEHCPSACKKGTMCAHSLLSASTSLLLLPTNRASSIEQQQKEEDKINHCPYLSSINWCLICGEIFLFLWKDLNVWRDLDIHLYLELHSYVLSTVYLDGELRRGRYSIYRREKDSWVLIASVPTFEWG
jgi:hypothetical protein